MGFSFDKGFRARVLALTGRGPKGGVADEGARGRVRGGRQEFREHREYVPGDDPRDIDWNLLLRLDTLAVKEYTHHEAPSVLILLDRSGSMGIEGDGKDRIAREVAVGIGQMVLSSGSELTIGFPSEGGPVYLGRYRSPRRFDALCSVVENLGPPQGPTRLEALLRLPPAGAHGRVTFLITDALVEPLPLAGLVALARGAGSGVLLHAVADTERQLTFDEPATFVDPETGRSVLLSGNAALTAAYREELTRHEEAVLAACRAHGLGHVALSDAAPFEDAVLAALALRR